MHGFSRWLLVCLALGSSGVSAGAQISFGGCFDAAGHMVPSVAAPALSDVAFATMSPNGTPLILYSPQAIASVGPIVSRFGYLHECAHHALGQILMVATGMRGPITAMDEQAADCAAIVWLVQNREFGSLEVKQLQRFFYGNPGNFTHFPGPVRSTNLGHCLTAAGIAPPGSSSDGADDGDGDNGSSTSTPPASVATFNANLRIWSKSSGNPAQMDVAVDTSDIGSISNLRTPETLDIGPLSPGIHTFSLTNITAYALNPYGQLVPISSGMVCNGSFSVRFAHTYQLIVRVLPNGQIFCAFR
jgi:hypothetical protein